MVLSRRNLIRGSAAIGAASLVPGCVTPGSIVAGTSSPLCLPHPIVRPDRLIRDLVGLRPFRPSGFVVRAEQLADKRLIHNYGHGGAGITLSWGSSRLATNLGLPGHSGPVAVIGAGVMGLTTARLAQEAGYDVTVYAKALPPETTSNIAGGQWYPSTLYRRDAIDSTFETQLIAASDYSYRRFQIMIGSDYGVRWMTNYELSRSPHGMGNTDRLIARMLPEIRPLDASEHPFGDYAVRAWQGMLIEPPVFLRRLLRDIQIAGGRIAVRDFRTPIDIAALPETLVFNCTGLGARDLFGDKELEPLRGQLAVLLPQPEIDYALLGPGNLYMFSRSDGLILGGTADPSDNLTPDPAIRESFISGYGRLASQWRCNAAA